MTFKESYPLEKRIQESSKIMTKYPDRIPIICEKNYNEKNDIPQIDKTKFLVPQDLSVGQFIYVIRRRLKLPPEKALFLFLGKRSIAPTTEIVGNLYERYKDEDGFLYTFYSGENAFG